MRIINLISATSIIFCIKAVKQWKKKTALSLYPFIGGKVTAGNNFPIFEVPMNDVHIIVHISQQFNITCLRPNLSTPIKKETRFNSAQ